MLPTNVHAHVNRSFQLLKMNGYKLGMPQAKKLNSEIYELRIRGSLQVRLLYGFYNQEIYLVHGFIKKTQKIPKKELITAIKRFVNLTKT